MKFYTNKKLLYANNLGFTLAEVLITLGIIGVVAAITIPNLIQHYKRLETATKVKKFYSLISQTILASEQENGPSIEWAKAPVALDSDNNVNKVEQRNLALAYFYKYIGPYIKYIKIDENPRELADENGNASRIKIYLADGTVFYFNNGYCIDFRIDTNGDKQPNTHGKDQFTFLLCAPDYANYYFGENKNFGPYCLKETACNTREKAKAQCVTNNQHCTQLLMMDGWEFKDDYPYKL